MSLNKSRFGLPGAGVVTAIVRTNGGDALAAGGTVSLLAEAGVVTAVVHTNGGDAPATGLAFTPIISSTIRSTNEGVEGAEELRSFAEPSADSGLAMPEPPARGGTGLPGFLGAAPTRARQRKTRTRHLIVSSSVWALSVWALSFEHCLSHIYIYRWSLQIIGNSIIFQGRNWPISF